MDIRVLGSALLAVAALGLSLAASLEWFWLAVAVAALLVARTGPARPLVAASAVIQWTYSVDGLPWSFVAGSVLLTGVVLAEELVHRAARPVHLARRLPTAGVPRDRIVWLTNSAAVAAAGLCAVLGWPVWTLLAPSLAAGAVSAGLLADGWHRRRTRHRAELTRLRDAIAAHRPRFLLYFSAPPGSEYQARMWLPYLERIGEPFLVVLAEPEHLAGIARATRAPVVVHRTAAVLEAVMVPGLRAAFYVNNGMKNAHCVRFKELTHVQLYHGYSDKPVSVNPIAAIFDLIFVPGQAIADQFLDSTVDIPKERFRVVGRPQAEELTVATRSIDQDPNPVVLYAPTWAGEYQDSNHCSLPIGEQIVRSLLARGATVLVRPHPYTRRHPESMRQLRRIQRLVDTTAPPTLAECMNLADATICDVSSIASQFLYTGKPYAITDMVTPDGGFTGSLPLARGGYVIHRDGGNLAQVLDDLLDRDPRADARRELRSYYLGDFPTDRYADAFLTEVRRLLT